MEFKKMAKTVALLKTLLGFEKPPIDAEKKELNLTAEQREKVVQALGSAEMADKAIQGVNSEIKQMANENLNIKAIQDEIDALVQESNLNETELNDLAQAGDANAVAKIKALGAKQKQMQQAIDKLVEEPEGEQALETIKGKMEGKVSHSATHLFASNNAWDAFEGRDWNRRASGQVAAATDFTNQTTIQKLNDDLDLFFRKNPEKIQSLHRDNFGLPSFWPKRTNIDDRVADGTIVTAEITQARKLPWLPKNKQAIKAEEGRIFPVQIDIEFIGYFLQQIEASWLNMLNKEGSQPYKHSFVEFLVSEIDKKARLEDRIASIKGVYVETPENATTPGRFINRQDGLLCQIERARDITKKFRAFDLGMPTTTNIVDYVDNFIKKLPYEVRVQQGLVLYMSDYWLKAYKRRYEQIHGSFNNYEGYPVNPKDYANIKFEVLIDMEGSDFMFMTFDNNIEILENLPNEKSLYHFEYLKRIVYIWADYKLGIRMIHIGNKLEAGDPLEFEVQSVWSNTAPVFNKDFYVPVHDEGNGVVAVPFKNMYVTKDFAHDITKFEKTTENTVIKIKGDTSLSADRFVKKNADLLLASDFNLKSGGTLVLFVQPDGKLKEITRSAAPETIAVEKGNVTSNAIDANLYSEFQFTGTATTSITTILNGVEGKSIKVYGTDTANVDVNFTTVNNIRVNANVTLGDANDFIQLTYVDGIWVETNKSITAN